ncbi:MAG: hypothetical protein ACF8PN_00430 [Phycisphaerales bacterium]
MTRVSVVFIGFASLLVGASGVLGQTTATPADAVQFADDEMIVRIALDRLRLEAREFKATGRLPREDSDFHEDFEYAIGAEQALNLISDRLDDDEVTDAYLRWQLLPFASDRLEALTEPQAVRLARRLPQLTPSPLMEPARHATLERFAERAGRNESTRLDLEAKWEAWQVEARLVRRANEPAEQFRDAVIDAAPDTHTPKLLLMLHDLEDRIETGHETRSAKSAITRELKKRKLDESLSERDRWKLIEYIESIEQLGETEVIREVTVFANTPAKVSYSTLEVSGTNVANWTAYLNGHDP